VRARNIPPNEVDTVTRRKRDDPRQAPASGATSIPPAGAPYRGVPSRDDAATVLCPLCHNAFSAAGRALYCSDACRKTAWRRRHQASPSVIVVPARGRPRRPITVYECASCGTRALGQQRCDTCGAFSTRVGLGGLCPHCDEPVAIDDLVDQTMIPPAIGAGRR
jgi:hypothetical protein